MSLSACITSVSGPELLPDERAFLHDASPWGVILMGRSCETKPQVKALVDDIKSSLGRDALIFIDQEGGRVARLKAPEWPIFPAAAIYGEAYAVNAEQGTAACKLGHHLMALELSELGICADCAPVGDLRQATTHDAIGDRAFGYDVEAVSALAGAALDGLQAGGVAGCIKHMPGQGRASVDSHYDLPRVEAPKEALEQDFSVFEALAPKALMGMTGHVSYDALSPDQAATISKQVISEIIRERIGFDGLLMTDDLGMSALGGTLKSRGEEAMAAGCDILLHCSGFLNEPAEILREMQEVAEVAGDLSGEALSRTQRVEASLSKATPLDKLASRAVLDEMLSAIQAGV